jgi:hypothetical protein
MDLKIIGYAADSILEVFAAKINQEAKAKLQVFCLAYLRVPLREGGPKRAGRHALLRQGFEGQADLSDEALAKSDTPIRRY